MARETAPIRATMDDIASADCLSPGAVDLYADLAPVYDFVAGYLYDYDATAAFVDTHAPSNASSVAVGACGGGRLLARLTAEYDDALGFDRSRAMLELSATRTDAPLAAGDLTTFVAPSAFDAFTVLGGTVAHLPTDDGTGTDGVVALFENAHESLTPGGVFVCDFMEAGSLESGQTHRDTFGSGRFRVDRTTVVTNDPADPDLGRTAEFAYGFEITDTRADESVRVGTSVPVREFDTGAMLGAALAAGFDDVTLATPPTEGRALVAHRAE